LRQFCIPHGWREAGRAGRRAWTRLTGYLWDPSRQSTGAGGVTAENTAQQKPPSIERIQRLERLERERLDEKARKEERRRQVIAGAKPSGGRHDLVDRIEEITKYPLAILGVAWLVLAIIVVSTGINHKASAAAVSALFALWAVMLVEYLVRLTVTPDTRGYLRRRWAEPVTVVLPPTQGWHLIGIERTTLLLQEGELRLEYILRHHSLFRVLIAAAGTLFVGAWAVLLFEENSKTGNIHSYPQAVWWAIVTVTTVGYGDKYPVTTGGRIVAAGLMLVGIGLIGVLTATVASVFMKEHTDSAKEEYRKGHADLGQQLAVIRDRLGDVEHRLGATPQDLDAVDSKAGAEAAAEGPVDTGQQTSTT
jgi:voltage-gated potassium channel